MGVPQDLIAGRYRLQRRIAAGGMGVVWEARDELLQRSVAVKQLRTQAGVSEEDADLAKQRAMREARITARLHHRNAVPVFDTVEHDGEPCLVMQYVPSEPLSALIKRRGPLPVGETARVGAEVAAALAAAHALGIVHRDVKPGNVLIADSDGTALISDFGISHALGDANLTSTGFVHGTPAYLAPEVARGDESTFASDVFSLGSTLYAASEGRAPFGEDPNSIAVLHRVASGGFQAPKDSGPLGPLLLQMMASDPAARPTMREAARRLAAVQEAEGDAIVPTLPLVSDPAPEDDAWDDPDEPTAWVPVTGDATATLVAEPVAQGQPVTPEPDVEADVEPEPEPEVESEVAAESEALAPAATAGSARTVAATTGPSRTTAERATAPSEATTKPSPTLLAATRTAPPLDPAPVDPAPLEPPAPEPASPPPGGRRRRGALLGVLAAVVVLALAGFGLLQAFQSDGSADPGSSGSAAAGSGSASASTASQPSSAAPTTSATPTSTPTPSTSASSPSPTATSSPTSSAAQATTPVEAIQHYYSLVPDDTSAAWPLMTASYQTNHAGGRQEYDAFWASVRSVSATNVRTIGTNLVEATITYTRASGVSVEDTTFRLVKEGGVLKIADSSVD